MRFTQICIVAVICARRHVGFIHVTKETTRTRIEKCIQYQLPIRNIAFWQRIIRNPEIRHRPVSISIIQHPSQLALVLTKTVQPIHLTAYQTIKVHLIREPLTVHTIVGIR